MPYAPLSTNSAVATPAAPPAGKGYTPLSTSSAAAAPAPQTAGYQPISKVGLITAPKAAPAAVTPSLPITPVTSPASTASGIPASALKGSLGGGYGSSNVTDPSSGKPLLTYENEKAKSSQLLSDRTAPTLDPTKPQKIDSSVLQNGRMPENVSQAIKAQFPGSTADELDHIMPLELGGSNNKSNLRLEPGDNPNASYSPSKNPTATDPMENYLAKQVQDGSMSLVDAWKAMAKAKNITLPEDGGAQPSNTTIQPDNQTAPTTPPLQSIGDKVNAFFGGLVSKIKGAAASTPTNTFQNQGPLSPALQIVHDSIMSYLSGLPVTSADTSGDFKANMSDAQIAQATSGVTPRVQTDLSNAGYDPIAITQIMKTPLPSGGGNTVADLPRMILHAATQSALGYGASLVGVDKDLQPGALPATKLSPAAQIAIYGTNPVAPFATAPDIAQAKKGDLKSLGSVGIAGLGLGLNVTAVDPGTFADDELTQLAKEGDPQKVVSLLTAKGIDKNGATLIAPIIAKASTAEQVKAILTMAAEHGLILNTAKEGASTAADEFAAQEAERAKSASAPGETETQPVKNYTGESNPGLTPEQSQTVAKSGQEGTAAAEAKSAAEQKSILAHNDMAERAALASPVPEDSFLQKAKNWLNPLKQQDPVTKAIFENYTKKLAAAKPLANEEARSLASIPKDQAWDATLREERGQSSAYTPQIKGKFQDLLAEGRTRGLDIPERKNYVPHAYAESNQEIKQVTKKYLIKKGVPANEVEAFLNQGKEISPDTAKRLGLNPFFTKTRIFPTYDDAITAGLHPKFTHPAQLAGHYREQMERNIANRELIQDLVDKGKLYTGDLAPRGYHPVNLEFSPKAYYAKPRLAQMLNGLFHDQNSLTFPDKVLGFTGKAASTVQKIGLTTGVPGTSINLHSLGQIIMHITAGDFKGLAPFLRSNVNGASVKFFVDNADVLKRMAANNINVGKTVADYERMYPNLLKPGIKDAAERGGPKSVAGYITKQTGTAFANTFSRKNFTSLMPQFIVQTFKDASDRFVSQGMTQAAADKLAAETTKVFHGLIGNIGRAQGTEDVLSTAFYAPPFRESILKTLWNSAKSATTEIKNPAYYKNRRLLAGIILTYGLYAAANKKLNGHWIWQNPSTHQFDLQIPTGSSTYAYVPFMPTFLTVPRDIAGGTLSLAEGDLKGATQQYSSILSAPLQLFGQLYANKDFYGRAIYNDTDSGTVKAQKISSYLGLNTVPPFVKETVNYLQNRSTTPIYQAITTGLALPVKYGTAAQNNNSDFYNALTNYDAMHAQALTAFRPTFDNIQGLLKSGQKDQAQQLVNNLSDSDYILYKDLKAGASRSATTKAEAQFLPTYHAIQDLISGGKSAEAQQQVNGLSPSDYKLYQAIKKKGL